MPELPDSYMALHDLIENTERQRIELRPNDHLMNIHRDGWLGIVSRMREVGEVIESINRAREQSQENCAVLEERLRIANEKLSNVSDWLRQLDWKTLRKLVDLEYSGAAGSGDRDFTWSDTVLLLQNVADLVGLSPLDTAANIETSYQVTLTYEFSFPVEHNRDDDPVAIEDLAVEKASGLLSESFAASSVYADSFTVKKITEIPL